jgi:cobaltochelatase CobS
MSAVNTGDKIVCKIDGALVHSVELHIKQNHSVDWTMERYRAEFPNEPILSELAKAKLRERQAARATETAAGDVAKIFGKRPFHEVFGLGATKAAMNSRGEPIMISVQEEHDAGAEIYMAPIDPNYVFPIDIIKTILLALEHKMSFYLWGYHGTGKTTAIEQTCARTRRPFVRVQHTINTEEAHIVGQYVVRDGATHFQLGPLPEAMLNGYVYCADEYDFAMPSVLSVYQPVLEGKPLIIKEAPPEMRVIHPHPNFRFAATGNTNGGGDETGLYQGTQMQNAANYSRFAVTEEVPYMDKKIEVAVISSQAKIMTEDAETFVKFATEVRDSFARGVIGATISPRELIASAKIGVLRGSDWKTGIRQGFIARLSRVDKETVGEYAKRLWA